MTTFKFQGTGQTTGGGGGSVLAVAAVAAVLIFGGGAAAVTAAVAEVLLVVAVVVGVLILAVVALFAWWVLRGRPAGEAKAEAAALARVAARELDDARRAAVRHQRALELAAASAPVIQNIIPAVQYPQPQPVTVVRSNLQHVLGGPDEHQ